ncbi:uncharacterized protein LOC135844661 [Planococcus citri]|uniref:uncharacterized protein LOC135844661 n=1 Tax=Planococcus citri TaxID=170843 RepID=UPI0031F73448
MADFEINDESITTEYVEKHVDKIVRLLIQKEFKDILVLFPPVRPMKGSYDTTTIKRWYDFLHIFQSVEVSRNVRFASEPTKLLARLMKNPSVGPQWIVAHDEYDQVVPNMELFYYDDRIKDYKISIKARDELLGFLRKICDPTKRKIDPRTSPTDEPHVSEEEEDTIYVSDETGNVGHVTVDSLRLLINNMAAASCEASTDMLRTLNRSMSEQLDASLNTSGTSNLDSGIHDQEESEDVTEEFHDLPDKDKFKHFPANSIRMVNGISVSKDSNDTQDPTIFSKPPMKVSEINRTLMSQLLHDKSDQITCVIPLRLGNACYPAQLDSGAVPNIMSEETAKYIMDNHPDDLEFIQLDVPAVCVLADSNEAETADYIIVPTLYFGKHALKIPFYVLKGCNQVFIIGTQSMRHLGIEPRISRGKAICRPSPKVHTEVVDFLTPEQYENKLNISSAEMKSAYKAEMNRILGRTSTRSNYYKLPEGVIDDGPEIFVTRLKADLADAVIAGRITLQQSELAYRTLSEFKDVFSRFPGKYIGKKEELIFNIPYDKIRYRGAKYNPSRKLMDDLRKELQVMLATNVIEPSNSIYINPIVVNVKKSGEIRVCLNPVDLNPILEVNYNEAGLLDRIITEDAEAKLFSTLDFVSGFWQIVLAEISRKFCAFQVDGRVYQFIRLPYGLKISSAVFVNMVNDIIPDKQGITKYVDDILLRSATFEKMLGLLVEVLTILRTNNLRLNAKKTTFFKGETEHLGFNLSHGAISKQSAKIDKFNDYIAKHTKNGKFILKDKIQILEFIGLTGLYRRFVPNYQQIIAPLYELTCDNVPFEWGPRQDEAVKKLIIEYTKDFELTPPRNKIDLYLDTYTSTDAMNAVLYQHYENQDEIIMFSSHSFKPHQKKYTLIEREMYTLAKSIKKLQLWLHGRTIHVRSDLFSIVSKFETLAEIHRKAAGWITLFNCYNLIYDLRKRHKKWFGMQAPELTINSVNCINSIDGNYDLPGRIKTQLLEHLARIHILQKHDSRCMNIVQRLKTPDDDLSETAKTIKENLSKRYSFDTTDTKELLMYTYRDKTKVPVLPDVLFKDLILYLHEIYGHVGANKLEAIFRRLYYSANAKHLIRFITGECLHCKTNKNYSERKPLEFAYTQAYSLADVISVDILGPISNYSDQPRYLLVSKDVLSGKIWLSPLKDIVQETVAGAMDAVIKEIKAKKFKIRKIITDNATQFTNAIWKQLLTKHKIAIGHSTAHNPQSNLVERSMRDIGNRLRVKLNTHAEGAYSHHGWSTYIKEIEEEINNTPNDVNVPPNEVWRIDELDTEIPVNKCEIDARYQLRLFREAQQKLDVPSITRSQLIDDKLDMLNDVYTSSEGVVWVSIDGACANNGSEDAIAGIGICFHPNGLRNISERIENKNYTLTNNLAEAVALLTAMEIMLKNDVRKLRVISDSRYLTSAINDTFGKWSENDWKNSANKPVHHQDIFKDIMRLKTQFESFELSHVYARGTDFGNFTADKLARKAVYTSDFDISRINRMSNHQALIRLIKERRALHNQSREQKHNKRFGDPRIFQPGELVLITNHRLSSADKGASAKLYPKRHGPFVIISHAGKNCYEVQKIADKSDRRLINVRQITTYLNLYHLRILRKEPKLRSLLDKRSLRKRIYHFAEHRDLLEKFIKDLEAPKKPYRKFEDMKEDEKLLEFNKIRKKYRRKPKESEQEQFDSILTKVVSEKGERENIQKEANARYNLRKRRIDLNYDEGTDSPEDVPAPTRKHYKNVNSIILNLLNHDQRMKFVHFTTALPDWSEIPPTTLKFTC